MCSTSKLQVISVRINIHIYLYIYICIYARLYITHQDTWGYVGVYRDI